MSMTKLSNLDDNNGGYCQMLSTERDRENLVYIIQITVCVTECTEWRKKTPNNTYTVCCLLFIFCLHNEKGYLDTEHKKANLFKQ